MSGSVTPPSSSPSSTISQTGTSALGSLSDNFTSFLSLLMTQLQNQDPTSPLDSNQFTSELVQFTSVQQQIDTNSDLTQLIQLTQASQIEQSTSMIGKPVTVNSSQLSLQNGTAAINFNTTSAEPVGIAVFNASGVQVQTATLTSSAGANTWTWNGQNANGTTMPDGAYTVTVNAIGVNGATSAVPFTVTGTATAVQNNSGTVDLQMGGLTLPFSAVDSVGS
ncbi:flagellar hook assembly protein FlgD [Acidisphaera sp. S103]|uniref:flagellar hook assembly protein FlgD n=1 Tax=Acidisphaera sp. S103 TaxID=1747223 RepID=UPI00131BA059|nr:flagellar hook capping FlgD N-terminal domain-containing protein [Acidisphaera sp. S103]